MSGRAMISEREDEAGLAEVARAAPDARLAPFVEGIYRGFAERVAQRSIMRETPTTIIPVIINFGAPWRLTHAADGERCADSFLSGLDEHYTLVESTGLTSCLQVDFTPLGALRLLDRPLGEIVGRIVALDELFGPAAATLVEQLRESSWRGRFALLDEFFLRRFAGSEPCPGELAFAWRALQKQHGQVPIGALAEELGWSHKRLIASFRRDFGLTPRRAGRVMRFARAVRLLRGAPDPRWAEIALDCGYYDQAHLNRDFRDFAGVTPTEFLAGLLPDPAVRAAQAG